jgi:hypothetical protein
MPDIETGAQLKKRRESKGVTQGKLGADLDYAEKSIARLEGQKTIPRVVGPRGRGGARQSEAPSPARVSIRTGPRLAAPCILSHPGAASRHVHGRGEG